MTALMRLDRDPMVLAISAQPMRIHWAVPRGQGDVQHHTPDFFVVALRGTRKSGQATHRDSQASACGFAVR